MGFPPRARLRIATRASRLALIQARRVADLLAARAGVEAELVEITTKGDADRRPFAQIGGRGLFVAEVERAVLDGRADVAVHSAKDLTSELDEALSIVCVPERADVRDAVVGGLQASGEERLRALPEGARVGTSSMRRRSLIAELRPDLEVVELRGNLDTRLSKVVRGEVDAAVVALAGLQRLGMGEGAPLDAQRWVPAPAQGALAVQAPSARAELAELFAPLDDRAARAAITLERAFAAALEGGCSVPLGCYAAARGDELVATGYVGSPDGGGLRDRISGPASDAAALGRALAEALLSAGADELIEAAKALGAAPQAP